MKRIGLVVAYDGTNYCGWQTQPNGITVQGVLNETLSELLGEKIETIGASRTDAGVHAMGNVAVFDTNTRIPGEKISYALNQRLPEDIRIQLSEEVEPDFHPRYCDSEKTYEYRILNRKFPVPTERLYTYFYHYKLDVYPLGGCRIHYPLSQFGHQTATPSTQHELLHHFLYGQTHFSQYCRLPHSTNHDHKKEKDDPSQTE